MTAKSKVLKEKKTSAFKSGKTSGNYLNHEDMSKIENEYRRQALERPSKYKRVIK